MPGSYHVKHCGQYALYRELMPNNMSITTQTVSAIVSSDTCAVCLDFSGLQQAREDFVEIVDAALYDRLDVYGLRIESNIILLRAGYVVPVGNGL